MRERIGDRAFGRWPDILAALGVERRFLRAKNGPCPMCGGTDRWKFDDKGHGTWLCSHCGAGGGIRLVMLIRGETFPEAAKSIEGVIGSCSYTPPPAEKTKDEQRAKMNALWASGQALGADSVAGRYLTTRTGFLPVCDDLRAIPAMRYHDDGEPTLHPGLLALVRTAHDRPINVHRTYLAKAGGKANVKHPRKMMGGTVPHGAAVRLGEIGPTLAIAEGIETALSVTALFGVPCWAALNAGGLQSWQPPEGVERVIICADTDANFVGQAAAYALAKRLCEKWTVEVRLPAEAGQDWNDILSARRLAA